MGLRFGVRNLVDLVLWEQRKAFCCCFSLCVCVCMCLLLQDLVGLRFWVRILVHLVCGSEGNFLLLFCSLGVCLFVPVSSCGLEISGKNFIVIVVFFSLSFGCVCVFFSCKILWALDFW